MLERGAGQRLGMVRGSGLVVCLVAALLLPGCSVFLALMDYDDGESDREYDAEQLRRAHEAASEAQADAAAEYTTPVPLPTPGPPTFRPAPPLQG